MIVLNDIYKSFKNKEVLKGVKLTINSGDILGYIGENGSGKTTTIKILCGINNPTKGEVITEKKEIKFSALFDFNGLYPNLSAYENLLLFCKLSDLNPNTYEETIKKYLTLVDLYEERNTRVKNFSKGMKRRLALIRAVIADPNLLILDEPFDGIDVKNHYFFTRFLKQWVKEDNRCVLVTSHNMNELENLCNKVCFLEHGVISKYSTLNELIESNSQCIRIKLDENENVENTINILKANNIIILNYTEDNYIEIEHSKTLGKKDIIDILFKNNIVFTDFTEKKINLEEIYMKKVNSND